MWSIDLALWGVLLILILYARAEGIYIKKEIQIVNVCESEQGWQELDPGSWDVINLTIVNNEQVKQEGLPKT